MQSSLLRCRQCQSSVLDSFAALVRLTVPPPVSTLRFTHNTASLHTSRILHQTPSLEAPSQSDVGLPPLPSATASSSSSTDLPWYLRIPPPTPPLPTRPALPHQDLPPIPSDAPVVLTSILTHLSTSIGLDNLSLLDLRSLSPPPALGSNLLMILGTARSTKHLNVSADRFCRWCRSEYKLRPYADGLLGRNELKLKLRRRARRLKLAASVGNTLVEREGSEGDGITTGWICVNVGRVDDVIPREEEQDLEQSEESGDAGEVEYINPEGGYIGFGVASDAPRIVVQMFTEEKRAELDLEGLWDARLARSQRRKEQLESLADGMKDREREIAPKPEDEEENEVAEAEEIEQNEKLKKTAERGESEGQEGGGSKVEKEIEKPDQREGEDESKPMGGIGAS